MNKVVEFYNNGQGRYEILKIECVEEENTSNSWVVEITGKWILGKIKIGFYEWLGNPEYKVFEVFKAKVGFIMDDVSFGEECDTIKSPAEIISYFENQIK